jgi:hypothetical protein
MRFIRPDGAWQWYCCLNLQTTCARTWEILYFLSEKKKFQKYSWLDSRVCPEMKFRRSKNLCLKILWRWRQNISPKSRTLTPNLCDQWYGCILSVSFAVGIFSVFSRFVNWKLLRYSRRVNPSKSYRSRHLINQFYVHVTVHRNKFLYSNTNR